MKASRSQLIMVWVLPVILIGGLIWPELGYLVAGMIVFFLTLSFFRQRYWCWFLCPRGAFLQIFLPWFSRNRRLPAYFRQNWFRWTVFIVLISYLVFNLIRAGLNPFLIGGAFITMCILTTLIGFLLGIFYKPRSWCLICPMGTLQETIGKSGRKRG